MNKPSKSIVIIRSVRFIQLGLVRTSRAFRLNSALKLEPYSITDKLRPSKENIRNSNKVCFTFSSTIYTARQSSISNVRARLQEMSCIGFQPEWQQNFCISRRKFYIFIAKPNLHSNESMVHWVQVFCQLINISFEQFSCF